MLRCHTALPRPLVLVAPAGVAAILAFANLGAAAAATSNVSVRDNSFAAPSITITAGDAVVWTDAGNNPHTVTADDGSFDSGTLSNGQTFSRTFTTPGTIRYYCRIHGAAGGLGMSGTIIVEAQATTTTAATTTSVAGSTATTGAATTTTAGAVSAKEATRTSTSSPGAAASAASTGETTAQPTALARTGFGPYTAVLAAIGLALLLTGAIVVRHTHPRAGERKPEPPSP